MGASQPLRVRVIFRFLRRRFRSVLVWAILGQTVSYGVGRSLSNISTASAPRSCSETNRKRSVGVMLFGFLSLGDGTAYHLKGSLTGDILFGMGRSTIRRKRALEILIHVRSIMGCQVCGLNDPDILELHHVIPIGKNRNRSFQSLTIVARELALMTVVCANCHARITRDKLISPPAMGEDKARSFVDLFRKERVYLSGQDHPGTALTPNQVEEARNLHPGLSYNQIAKQFGVCKNTIVKAVKKRSPYTT